MTKTVRLLVVLVVLVAWDRILARREAGERSCAGKLGRLTPPSVRDGLSPAFVTVERGGTRHVYARRDGVFRCTTSRDALGDEGKLTGLVRALSEAEGVVERDPARRPEDHGLDVAATQVVTLYGPAFDPSRPEGDVRLRVQVGRGRPGREGCYARWGPGREVWAIDQDLLALLAPPGERLPPLADPLLVPSVWTSSAKGLERLQVTTPAGESYALVLRKREPTPEDLRTHRPPFDWVLDVAGVQRLADQALAGSYAAFVTRARLDEVVEPARSAGLAFDGKRGRLVLAAREGAPLELVAASAPLEGKGVVRVAPYGVAVTVAPEVLELLWPSSAKLVGPGADPWKETAGK